MTDLPTLKIGCGILYKRKYVDKHIKSCEKESLCPTCQHNLDAVKAHASVYRSEMFVVKKGGKGNPEMFKYWHEAKGARDAVLKLAG